MEESDSGKRPIVKNFSNDSKVEIDSSVANPNIRRVRYKRIARGAKGWFEGSEPFERKPGLSIEEVKQRVDETFGDYPKKKRKKNKKAWVHKL